MESPDNKFAELYASADLLTSKNKKVDTCIFFHFFSKIREQKSQEFSVRVWPFLPRNISRYLKLLW